MNKTAIKNFAVWARQKLISDITYEAKMLGITEDGIAKKLPQSTDDMHFYDVGTAIYAEVPKDKIEQRESLAKKIKEEENDMPSYKDGFYHVVEEIAYTWFNRLIAIRFMEVNDYLPSGVRVLSSENKAKKEPDLVTAPFDTDLEFTSSEQDKIIQLKDDNELDELFRILFIKQCNKLHDVLPDLFEKTDDYSELLLTIPFTDPDGIIYHLVNDIEEVDFRINDEMYTDDGKIKADGQVEIIGWMYQYYISQKHEEVVDPLHGKTIKKADIPAATQLFTTDWVVRYMVDNSLGRYWIERNPHSKLAEKLDFFVTPKDGKINYIDEKISPTDLTFFDPCMGSGHILVYAFDVLMEIYRECGYSDRDAALSIVENNLFGMDIDKRAYQLAYFAVMMKARSYNRRALTQGIFNNLAVCEESNAIDRFYCDGITNDKEQNKVGEHLIDVFKDARELGTLQTVKPADYKSFAEYLLNLENTKEQLDLFSTSWLNDLVPKMLQFTKQAQIMSKKYAVVCTNPPYMNKLEGQLKKFVIDNYKPYSGDLFSVFMYRNFGYCKSDGYSAFMTPNVWMFIKTYENLRDYIINQKSIVSLIQMAKGAFFKEATVDIATFVLKNGRSKEKGLYIRLEKFKGDMEVQKEKTIQALDNKNCGYFYEAEQSNFSKIPGSPVAYWVSEQLRKCFEFGIPLGKLAAPRQGMATTNNNLFLRQWYEVSASNIGFKYKNLEQTKDGRHRWFPYNKGGQFRKWYGNQDYVVNWYKDGKDLKEYTKDAPGGRINNMEFYFHPSVTWSKISSGNFSIRFMPQGFIFDVAGCSIFSNEEEKLKYILGFTNSCVVKYILSAISPTLNYEVEHIKKLPIVFNKSEEVKGLIDDLICNSKNDWDSFETSWDFKKHPLLCYETDKVSIAFENWTKECDERFNQLKANEEELNRIFIDIYGLQGELTSEVEDKDVTVRQADLQRDIKSLISYSVGCMFGRYSLDEDGLAYAGGEWDNSKYDTFIPDADNCIPITDEEYFEDDIVGLFCAWLHRGIDADTI